MRCRGVVEGDATGVEGMWFGFGFGVEVVGRGRGL